jgi:hypothetical protein
VHEAGHAVIAHLQGRVIEELALCPAGDTAGYCQSRSGAAAGDRERRTEDVVLLLGAGFVAEARLTGHPTRLAIESAGEDLIRCMELAERRGMPGTRAERWGRIITMAFAADGVLGEPRRWAAVRRIAHELLEKRVISGEHAHALIERSPRAA